MTTATKQSFSGLFTDQEDREGFEHTILGVRNEPMFDKDGNPIRDNDNSQAYGITVYTASGQKDTILDLRLGGALNQKGDLSSVKRPAQFFRHVAKVTGFPIEDGTGETEVDRFCDSMTKTFAGTRVRLKDVESYEPWPGAEPFKGKFRQAITYEGRVEQARLTELQALAGQFIQARDNKQTQS